MGFMWIGTNDGLNRFDGHEFISFTTNSPGKSKICGNSISALTVDENGRIWIATEDNGFCSLDPELLSFSNHEKAKGDSLVYKRINDIIVLNENLIGLAIQDGYIANYYIAEDSLEKLSLEKASAVYEFDRIQDNEFASVGLNGGIRISSSDHLSCYVDSTNMKTQSLNSILVEEERIWTGSWGNTLCEFDRATQKWNYHLLEKELSENSSNIISEIATLDSSRIIIGTDNNGLFIFDKSSNSCQPILRNDKDSSAPKGVSIHALFKDKNGRLWIGSNAGIDIYDPILNQFKITFLPELNGAKIYDIIEKYKNLFIASTDGLLKINTSKGLQKKNEILGTDLKFRCFTASENSAMYVGSNKAMFELLPEPFGIKKLPPIDMRNITYASLENLTGSTFSDAFIFDDEGESWLCAMAYGLDLFIINLSENEGYALLPSVSKDNSLSTSHLIRKFHVDSKNTLWACSRNKGLIRIDQEFSTDSLNARIEDEGKIKFGLKSYFYTEKDGMPSKNVFDIVEDQDGSFWISTIGHGLIHFRPDSDMKFEEIDLGLKTIHGLEIDKNGNLWGITSKGILYYNPKNQKYKVFNQMDGISLDGMVGYWYKSKSGELYKGLNGTFIQFQPEHIQFNKAVNPVYLTHLNINNSPNDSLLNENNLELKYDQNFVTFQFSSPNYTQPKLNTYEYILEGVDPKWRTIQRKNEAVYTSLPSGTYPFKIRSSNNDGVWGDYKTLTTLTVHPPWYRTWWFYAFVILSIAAILFGLYKYRIAQLVKFYEMRNQIARDLHDDIGSTLGSISFYSEVAEQQLRKKGEFGAEDVVQKIGSTSREMMDSIGDIVWAVNPKNDTIEKLVDRMKNYALPLLSSKAIEIDFEVEENLNLEKLGMEKRKNMFLIFKESIHNSLKYSNCKKMDVHLLKDGKEITLSISDNGIGFDPKNSNAYNGNGMINIRERAKEMNADLSIESNLNMGTSVVLKFDLN